MMSRIPNIETRTCGFSTRVSSTIFLSFSTGVRSMSTTFYVKRISVGNVIYNFVCCCIMFHFYHSSIFLACSTLYSHLPRPALCGAGAAGHSGENTENKQIYADIQCRISHAETSIPNPPLRIGRASKVMDHAGEFFGSTPLHDPQDAASILQNYHRAVFRQVYPASWSITCILESQESRTHCLVHESCIL